MKVEKLLMPKSLLTKNQEKVLRLCHHSFKGLTQIEAAIELNVCRQAINQTLIRIKKKLPKFFPILTKQEAKLYNYYIAEGWGMKQIIETTKLSENAVNKTLKRVKKKGLPFPHAIGRVLSYDEFMDGNGKSIDNFVKKTF